MKNKIIYALLFTAALSLFSCSKDNKSVPIDNNNAVNIAQVRQDVQKALQEIQNIQGVEMNVQARAAGRFVVVPAGSNNALAQALTDAGEGGVVYLRSGLHTETESITIRSQVVVIGENGAVLKIKSNLISLDASGVFSLSPAIHVLNAPRTAIQNIEIQPTDVDGGVAILYENSPLSASMFCRIKSFEISILVEKSDQITLIGNKITSSTLWQTTGITCDGIIVCNGKSAWISNNEVESAVFGIWPCDFYGSCVNNNTHNNYIGIILCKVPDNAFRLPSGQTTGARLASGYVKVLNNQSDNNLTAGYLVIDGANNSVLEGNRSSGNGTYDIELVGDSYRFGFFTPKSFSNRVLALPTQKVKDCGLNNVVVGGQMVNNAIDPCN